MRHVCRFRPCCGIVQLNGETYYFCSEHCRQKFQHEPHRYTGVADQLAATAPVNDDKEVALVASGEYTCPMHPQIVRDAPGFCPICGMALEPRTVIATEENAELNDMRRRFWVSAALSLPLIVLAMSEFIPGDPARTFIGARLITSISLAFASPVVLWGGWPFFVRFWYSLINRSLNMFTLIGLGVGVAYVL